MEHIVTSIIASISPAALPIVVCVLGCCFIYLKINSQRKASKTERDIQKDELDKRLTLVEHDVEFMKAEHSLFFFFLYSIMTELTYFIVSLAKKADIK